MIEKIISTIETYGMLKGGEHITAALSGGADSVCLLLVLNELKERYSLTLDALHVNHCIRGAEADRDEEFCRKLCQQLGIGLTVRCADIPAIAAEKKQSQEEAARDVRYAVFGEHSKGLTATAHTASDNAETVIFNLARGTGLKGLCGIPPVRDNIIRPLIDVTRQEVEDFLHKNGQDFVTDSTNLSDDYTRNRIRHNIIPEILRINSGFYKTFCAELKIFSEENNYIEKNVKTVYNRCIDNGALCGIGEYDSVIRKRCISRFLKENSLPVSADRINEINAVVDSGGKISVAENVYAVCRKGILSIVRTPQSVQPQPLKTGENSIFPEKKLYAEIKKDSGGIIDTDKVCGSIILRGRVNGEKIRLSGKNFTSSVKKLLNERVRADLRPYIHFLADDHGVIYIENIGAAERVAPDKNTVNSLYISVKDVKK